MESNPLVSVIIIFLNEERFLQEAVESIFAQTYENWELLLVDDGSTDNSIELAQQYAERYPEKIRYLEHDHHQNKGMSASRNLGINHARGEYIAFLDADDIWLPQKLTEQVAIMREHPDAAFVCGRTEWWYSWTEKPEDLQKDFWQRLNLPLDTVVEPPTLLTLFLQDEWAALHDILVRRKVIDSVGTFEETFRGMYEDQVFQAKICVRYPVYVSSKCWYRYRQHSTACTSLSHQSGQYYSARQTYLNWLEQFLSSQGVNNAELWQVLRQELWPFRHPLLARISGRIRYQINQLKELTLSIGRQVLPVGVRYWLWNQWYHKPWPPVGWVRFGSLRRQTPISQVWPNYRGRPIDRYYIENFLKRHNGDIQGRVLELGDATYTKQFGGDRVVHSDVLHAIEGNPAATIVADLTCAEHIPSNTFDCIILTQALLLIYDLRAAIRTLHRILKPGGVLLATVPGITQIIRNDQEVYGQYWSFTEQSAQRLFKECFVAQNVETKTYGNVMAATAFLYGLAVEDLSTSELDYHDPDYQLIIGIRVAKAKSDISWTPEDDNFKY